MNKKEMIKVIVAKWCRDAKSYDEWEKRFIIHDSVENKMNRNWCKAGIELAYSYLLEKKDSDKIVRKFAYNEWVNI